MLESPRSVDPRGADHRDRLGRPRPRRCRRLGQRDHGRRCRPGWVGDDGTDQLFWDAVESATRCTGAHGISVAVCRATVRRVLVSCIALRSVRLRQDLRRPDRESAGEGCGGTTLGAQRRCHRWWCATETGVRGGIEPPRVAPLRTAGVHVNDDSEVERIRHRIVRLLFGLFVPKQSGQLAAQRQLAGQRP